jgi:hypothetical protein
MNYYFNFGAVINTFVTPGLSGLKTVKAKSIIPEPDQ